MGKVAGEYRLSFTDKYNQEYTLRARIKETQIIPSGLARKTGTTQNIYILNTRGSNMEYISFREKAGKIMTIRQAGDSITAYSAVIDGTEIIKVIPKRSGTTHLHLTDQAGKTAIIEVIV